MPPWLADRMTLLGTAIVEHIVMSYGPGEFLARLSDPFWFQALGAVDKLTRTVERRRAPEATLDAVLQHEREISPEFGGRTVFGHAKPTRSKYPQMNLFE